MKIVNELIKKILDSQQSNGGFTSYSSKKVMPFSEDRIYYTTFTTSLLLNALSNLKDSADLKFIKKRGLQFLINQKSSTWSFNYWQKDANQRKSKPYPDDLDDTFVSLIAIYKLAPNLIGGDLLASVVQILASTEVQEGGPYKTWLVSKDTDKVWQDIDIAVNSNVACFLSLLEIDLPPLNNFIEKCINKDNLKSPYYPSELPTLYYLSGYYNGESKDKLIHKLLKFKYQDPLELSLIISSLINFGYKKIDRYTQKLNNLTIKDIWQSYPFCIDPDGFYNGAPWLTAAFYIEALNRSSNLAINDKNKQEINPVLIYADMLLNKYDFDIKTELNKEIQKVIQEDRSEQITKLPFYFSKSLNINKKIPSKILTKLGAANLFGWIAYTIYDDFLDSEGNAKMLPLANICFRELIRIFYDCLPNNNQFLNHFHQIMKLMETANYSEVTKFRTKDYKTINKNSLPHWSDLSTIAHKSLGHSLTPLAILYYLGYGTNSKEVKLVESFFINYLTAKQLHDDAHDWQEDLERGIINPVGSILLEQYFQKYQDKRITIKKLQKLYWYQVFPTICQLIQDHINKAEDNLKSNPIIKNNSPLQKLLNKLSQSTDKAIQEQQDTLKFLRNFGIISKL